MTHEELPLRLSLSNSDSRSQYIASTKLDFGPKLRLGSKGLGSLEESLQWIGQKSWRPLRHSLVSICRDGCQIPCQCLLCHSAIENNDMYAFRRLWWGHIQTSAFQLFGTCTVFWSKYSAINAFNFVLFSSSALSQKLSTVLLETL